MTVADEDPHIPYFDMGQWPVEVAFTDDEKAFRRECKRRGLPGDLRFAADNGARCTWMAEGGEDSIILITIGRWRRRTRTQVAAMVAHECMHAVRYIMEDVGEKHPGAECEAYLIQWLVQCCLNELWGGRSQKVGRGHVEPVAQAL